MCPCIPGEILVLTPGGGGARGGTGKDAGDPAVGAGEPTSSPLGRGADVAVEVGGGSDTTGTC